MQTYGNFEPGRRIGAGHGTAVYAAREETSGAESRALKLFAPHLTSIQTEIERAPAPEWAAFLEDAQARIEIQKRGAESSAFVAPVFDHGRDASSVWYVTRLYPQSLERILRERTRVARGQVVHLLLGAVEGALALKQACGRSHGNLKPGNVLLSGAGRLQKAEVAVADPLAGGPEQAEAFELADLRATGRMLYELVRRREMGPQDWASVILPLELSAEWTEMFGKDAPRWLALCNRLLDPQLGLSSLDLARLKSTLKSLKPKPAAMPVAAAALLLVGGVAGVIFWRLGRPANVGRLVLSSDPPGASLFIDGRAVGMTPWKAALAPGKVSVLASNELGEVKAELAVGVGQTTRHKFQFDYGRALITSHPPGATVEDDEGRIGTTPLLTRRLRPGGYRFVVRLAHCYAETLSVRIGSGGTTNRPPVVALRRMAGPNVSVIVKVGPRELENDVVIANPATRQSRTGSPAAFELKPGRSRFELLLPAPWPERSVEVTVGTNTEQTVLERIPAGRVVLESTPPGAVVWAGTNLVGITPIHRLWPPGDYSFEWRLPFYATNHFETNLLDGATVWRRETLRQLLKPVELAANLEGTLIYATNDTLGQVGAWLVGPQGTNVALGGTNTLVARFADPQRGELEPMVVTNARASLTLTNRYRFDSAYGTALLEPPPGSSVSVGGIQLSARPVRRYQVPGQLVTYTVTAPHFDPARVALAIEQGQTEMTNVVLQPALYDVFLNTTPPRLHLRLLASDISLSEGLNRLPWGPGRYTVVASYPRLGSATNTFLMNEQGVTQALSVAYSEISLATRQRGLRVAEGDDALGFTPLTNLYLPPGAHSFTFTSQFGSEFGLTNWSTNLLAGANEAVFLPFQFLFRQTPVSLGHIGLLAHLSALAGQTVRDPKERGAGRLRDVVLNLFEGEIVGAVIGRGNDPPTLVPAGCFDVASDSRILLNQASDAVLGAPRFTGGPGASAQETDGVLAAFRHFGLPAPSWLTHAPGGLQPAEGLLGKSVVGESGAVVGQVQDLILDVPGGRVDYVVVRASPAQGVAPLLVPVPPQALAVLPGTETLALNANEPQFTSGPRLQPAFWTELATEAFASAVYRHYGLLGSQSSHAATTLVRSDSEIKLAFTRALITSAAMAAANARGLRIQVHNGQAALSGTVASEADKEAILAVARRVAGAGNVIDQLQVQ